MSSRKRKFQKDRKQRFDINDENSFESTQNQNMVYGILSKNKKIVYTILFLFVLWVSSVVVSFYTFFKLMF
jgi:hypothetical protein